MSYVVFLISLWFGEYDDSHCGRWRNWGFERLSDLPKFSHLIRGTYWIHSLLPAPMPLANDSQIRFLLSWGYTRWSDTALSIMGWQAKLGGWGRWLICWQSSETHQGLLPECTQNGEVKEVPKQSPVLPIFHPIAISGRPACLPLDFRPRAQHPALGMSCFILSADTTEQVQFA